MSEKLDRRHVLAAMGAGLLLPRHASAFGDVTLVDVAELDLGTTVSRPLAWKYVLYEVENTTSVEVNGEVEFVKPTDPALFEHPFVVAQGERAFELDDVAVEQLSRYLSYGGFLLRDEISGAENSGCDRSARELARRVCPTRDLAPVPRELLAGFSLVDQMRDFTRGVVDTRPVIFHLSLTFVFLFFTVRAIESRRWK